MTPPDFVHEKAFDARRDAEKYADSSPVYAELMAVYADLGELLTSGRLDADYVEECRELVTKSIELEGPFQRESDEAWALWWVRNTRSEGCR